MDTLYQAEAALWLLTHLGGLGSRSRRTAGSLRVVEPDRVDGLSFRAAAKADELAMFLTQGLTDIRRELARIHKSDLDKVVPSQQFDVLHRETCRIWVLTGETAWTTAEQAVDQIGARMRDFRSYRKPDHDTVRDWLERGKRPPTVERSAFGLPLPFRYSDGGPAGVLQGHDHDRRSSPLLLRVSQLASTPPQFVGVAVLFESELLPHGETLQFQRTEKETDPPKDYDLILKFIGGFKHLEVKYT